MVIATRQPAGRRGALTTELVVAMALFVLAFVPMALTVIKEHRAAHILYNRAVAGEILDGELEILLAGEWKTLSPGTQELAIRGLATNSLPPGRFQVTLEGRHLRVQWRATRVELGGHAAREALVPEK